MKKKYKFKKGIIITSCGLALAAIFGVGFSSWVIGGQNQSATLEGKITAEIGEIVDNSLSAKITTTEEQTIRFDALESDSCGNIISNGDSKVEKLDFTINYTINSNVSMKGKNVKVSFTFGGGASQFITNLDTQSAQYIDTTAIEGTEFTLDGSLATYGNEGDSVYTTVSYSNEQKLATIETTFTLKWGDAFSNENPCLADNSNVLETLNAFKSAFDNITDKTIDVTITPSYAA